MHHRKDNYMGSLPILYSFRRCPYAMRARMAIYINQICCELREVKLSDKPKEMLLISPKGTVPVLQLKTGKVLEESLDIVFWAFNINDQTEDYKRYKLNKNKFNDLISIIDNSFKYNLDRYKYPDRYSEIDINFHRNECYKIIRDLNSLLLNKKYLFSEYIGIADICIFPFIRQFRIADTRWFDEEMGLSSVLEWFLRINESEIFQNVMNKYEPWKEKYKSVIFNKLD